MPGGGAGLPAHAGKMNAPAKSKVMVGIIFKNFIKISIDLLVPYT